MLINPLDVKKVPNELSIEIESNFNVDLDSLKEHIITNFKEYLNDEDKEFLYDKLKEELYEKYNIVDDIHQEEIIAKIYDNIFGYGFLQKYIDDILVTDIRVVKYNLIYIKKMGIWERTEDKFESKEAFRNYIYYCVIRNNSNISFDVPIVIVSDKRNKLRIEAGISPVNVMDDSLIIRIHRPNDTLNLEILKDKYNMLDDKSYKEISSIIESKKNYIIAGKGGSGKTTLLRAMISNLPENVAITISEETCELYITHTNVIEREIISNRDKSKNINLEKLLYHSLVMSNDILVVGELKGEETATFFDAISTGHVGIATIHANGVENVIDRLTILFKRDIRYTKYDESFIKEILLANLDYIIYLNNYKVYEIATINHNGSSKTKNKLKSVYKKEQKC